MFVDLIYDFNSFDEGDESWKVWKGVIGLYG